MKANWKQVSNSEAQVPVFAINGFSLPIDAWAPLPVPGETLADAIRRDANSHSRLLSSCYGARSSDPKDHQTNKRRLTFNPRNKGKRTGPRTWGSGGTPALEPARPKGRANNNEVFA